MGIKRDECWSEDDFFVTRSQGGIFVPSLFWQNESSENDTGKTIRLGDVVYQGLGGMCQFPDNDRVMVSMTSDRSVSNITFAYTRSILLKQSQCVEKRCL